MLTAGDSGFASGWRWPRSFSPVSRNLCRVAWSGTPTYDLTTHVLGVCVNGPGDVTHDPHLGPLQWARGAVPTVDGLIEVEVP